MNPLIAFILSLIVLATGSTAGAGGDTVRNGGGLVENQFVYIWTNLDFFTRPCSDSAPACRLDAGEAQVLERVRGLIAGGLEPLIFSDDQPRAESARPWSRLIGWHEGRVLIFKRNLYPDQEAVRAGGALHLALPYLIVAAGGLADANPGQSWSLGLKLRAFWSRTSHILEGGSIGANKVYLQMMDGDDSSPGLWLVSDPTAMVSLAPLLEAKLLCPGSRPGRLVSSRNADWTGPAATSGNVVQLEAAATIEYVCDGGLQRTAEARALLSFTQTVFDPRQSFVRVFDIRDGR